MATDQIAVDLRSLQLWHLRHLLEDTIRVLGERSTTAKAIAAEIKRREKAAAGKAVSRGR